MDVFSINKDLFDNETISIIEQYNVLVEDFNESLSDLKYIIKFKNDMKTRLKDLDIPDDKFFNELVPNDKVIAPLQNAAIHLMECIHIFRDNILLLNSQIEELVIMEYEVLGDKQERNLRDGTFLLTMLEFRKAVLEKFGILVPGLKEQYEAFSKKLVSQGVSNFLRSFFQKEDI